MATISFNDVGKIYPGGTRAIEGVNMEIDDGEFVVCSEATPMLGGMWRYEFAVYNFWSHKALSEFSVPVGDASISGLSPVSA